MNFLFFAGFELPPFSPLWFINSDCCLLSKINRKQKTEQIKDTIVELLAATASAVHNAYIVHLCSMQLSHGTKYKNQRYVVCSMYYVLGITNLCREVNELTWHHNITLWFTCAGLPKHNFTSYVTSAQYTAPTVIIHTGSWSRATCVVNYIKYNIY